MSSGLIFITGATGFIGSAVALEALKAGYRLRISVRREPQISQLKKLFAQYEDKTEFLIVPEITQQSSFAGKLDGVDYIFHLASPLPHGINKDTYFEPAVNGTTAILKEAAKIKSIKKVVIISSIAALVPVSGIPDGGVVRENNDWDLSVNTSADFTGSNDAATAFNLYHASKILAYNATRDFKSKENPAFSLVTLHPGFVYGYNPTQTRAEDIGGTNGMLFDTIMTGTPSSSVVGIHIQDVVEAHIKVLDDAIPDGSRFVLVGPNASWSDVARIVQRDYPSLGAKISESVPNTPIPLDTSEAEKVLGMKWRSLDQMVKDVVEQQVELRKATM